MYYFYPYDDDDDDDDNPWDDDNDDDEDGIYAPGHFGGSATRENEDSDDDDDEGLDDNGNKKKRDPEDEGDGTGFGDDIGDGFGEDENPDKDEENQGKQKKEQEQDEEVEGEVKGKNPGLIKKIQMKKAIKKNANKYVSFAGFVRHTNLTCPVCHQKSIYRSMALSDLGLFFVGPWVISAISGTPVSKFYVYYCTNGKKFCKCSIENRKAWVFPTDTPPTELPPLQTKVVWKDIR